MKTEYTLIMKVKANQFIEAVQEKLDAGWVLYGSPYEFEGRHCQAMTNVSGGVHSTYIGG